MTDPNLASPKPSLEGKPSLGGKLLAIAALGTIGFEVEQGPNAHSKEALSVDIGSQEVTEVEAAPGVYEVYDKQTGALIDIGGGEEDA